MAKPRGPRKFAKFLEENDISLAAAGEALRVSDVTIHQWKSGDKNPTSAHRTAIRVFTNGVVIEDDWKTERERKHAADAAEVKPFDPSGSAKRPRSKRRSKRAA